MTPLTLTEAIDASEREIHCTGDEPVDIALLGLSFNNRIRTLRIDDECVEVQLRLGRGHYRVQRASLDPVSRVSLETPRMFYMTEAAEHAEGAAVTFVARPARVGR